MVESVFVEFECYNEEVRNILLEELEAWVENVMPEKTAYDQEVVSIVDVFKPVVVFESLKNKGVAWDLHRLTRKEE